MSAVKDAACPAVRIEHVSKTFPGQRALDDVGLEIEQGEIHALLGENGSGKSTLIKVLSGYHRPDPDPACRIYVGGEELQTGSTKASFAAGLRFVHQHLGVIPEFNAIENVALQTGYTRPFFISWNDQRRYTKRLLERLHVQMDIRKPLRDCRPVERSAVAIARALRDTGGNVKAIVLDEPTASLPAAETKRLFRLITELAESTVAIIYITHRLDEVFEVAHRVSVLRDGKLRGTRDMDGLTRDELVNLIVGRDLAKAFESDRGGGRKSASDAGAALEVRSLTAGRLRKLDLTIHPGEVVGVAGIAGSGREDVAHALVGARTREDGVILVDGKEIRPNNPRAARVSGLVLAPSNIQAGSAIGDFRVFENITLPSLRECRAGLHLLRRREKRIAREWISRLDVRPRRTDQLYRMLSGGNQQKVILGKWLNCKPNVLLLDEPTAGVDVGARQLIYQLIKEKSAEGLTVVICSSDVEDFVGVVDRAVVLRSGNVSDEFVGEDVSEAALLRSAVATAGPLSEAPTSNCP